MRRRKAGGKAGKVRRPGAPKASRRRETSVQLRRERDEALAREAATSPVLHVISSSPAELKLVFNALLENVTRTGLWDEWKDIETRQPLVSCTMIVTIRSCILLARSLALA